MGRSPLAAFLQQLFRSGEEDDEEWTRAARRVGAEVEIVPDRFFASGHRALWLDADGAALRVETFYEGKRTRQEITRLRVRALPALSSLSLRAVPRGVVVALGRLLGLSEISTGDAELEAAFRVSGHPRALVLELLDEPTRAAILEAGVELQIHAGDLEVTLEGRPSGAEQLVSLVLFGRAFAARARALVRALERIASALDAQLTGALQLPASGDAVVAKGQRHGATLSVAARVLPEIALTVVSFPVAGARSWCLEADSSGSLRTSGSPPFDAGALIEGAPASFGGARQVDTTVEIAFLGLDAPAGDVVHVVDALVGCVSPSPYR